MTSVRIFSIIYLIIVAVGTIVIFLLPASSGVAIQHEIKNPSDTLLSLLAETSKIVATINTAIFAAAAGVAIKGREWSSHWTTLDGTLIIIALVSAATSYYGIYMQHMALLGMVDLGVVALFETRIISATQVQFFGTLIAVLMLGLVFCRMMGDRRK